MKNEILNEGWCTCTGEPMGDSGLEGYNIGETYRFQHLSRDKDGKPYYRVYPNAGERYYETCGVNTFKKYFKINDNEVLSTPS